MLTRARPTRLRSPPGRSSTATTTEDEETSGGKTHWRSVTRTVSSVIDQHCKYETLAAGLRAKLGLDPASAARIGRDLALTRHMSAGATPLDDALAEIGRRRALAVSGDDG